MNDAELEKISAALHRAAAEFNKLVGEAVNAGLLVGINRADESILGKVEHHLIQVTIRRPS